MKKTELALIGVGGIGFRHFQSLMSEQKHEIHMTLVDVDESALLKAREYEEQSKNPLVSVDYSHNIYTAKGDIDIVIIATSSLVRRKVFEELLEISNVKYFVFEKFLFPRISDYYEVKKILDSKHIKAYVNCPCRLYPGYIQLKKELKNLKHLDAILSGSNWGLACNVIHTVDVIGFLLDSYENLTVDSSLLDDDIIMSKRKGYIEFTGRLICEIGDKARIIFDSEKTGETPFKMTLYGSDKIYTISEVGQTMVVSHKGETVKKEFSTFFQSQLTVKVVDDLVENEKCGLTGFDDTIQWHMELLNSFLGKYNQISGKSNDICPIT